MADEVGALAGQGVAEDPLAERRARGDAGAEEVRRPPDGDADPAVASAAASSSAVMAARVRPLTVVAASGRSSVIGLPPVGP